MGGDVLGLSPIAFQRDRWKTPTPSDASFDLGVDLVCVVDAQGRFIAMNNIWEERLGWSRDELQQRTMIELVHPEDVERTRGLFGIVTDPDAEVQAFENRYRAKDGGYRWMRWNARSDGSRWFAFASDITEEREREQWLRSVLREEHLAVYAQPILDQRRMRVSREELLVRLRTGPHGEEVIPPGSFLPDAERLGLVAIVDRWMLRKGVELAARGRAVAVNLSARSIDDRDVREELCEIVEANPPSPGALVIELTETAALQNLDAALDLIERLEPLGCQFALDDFGTGFGSLTYLRQLAVQYLKIDRSFVSGVTSNPADRSLVRSIIAIASELGLLTVAEGVEDGATLNRLREYGVDYLQGFLIGAPEPLWSPAPIRVWSSSKATDSALPRAL
ncbi:MAG: EAL domain-containing protein [Solirubrobacterales bacterium]